LQKQREQPFTQLPELGADKALNSSEDWNGVLGGEKVDLVIESVGPATFNKSLEILRNGGTIVTFGSSTGDQLELNLRSLFYAQQNLLGSTMGSAEEYHEMLQFIEKHQIRPVLDQALPLEEFEKAFDRLDNAEQWGKIAFKISV
jgi:zinc-binding alcohol dehydrogenase/oxidoreductase